MKQNEELKDCPMCAKNNPKIKTNYCRDYNGHGKRFYWVECPRKSCGIKTAHKGSKAQVIKAWNTRHQPEQPSDKPDITKCPSCGGDADNGFDRCSPPNPYDCSKCEEQPSGDVSDTHVADMPQPIDNKQNTTSTNGDMPDDAINNLIHNQQQIDADGVMCVVSRQALHEVISYIGSIRADLASQTQVDDE